MPTTHNMEFKFDLLDKVRINVSGECGDVVAVSASYTGVKVYCVRYKNAAGIAVETWWNEDVLEHDVLLGDLIPPEHDQTEPERNEKLPECNEELPERDNVTHTIYQTQT